MDSSSLEVLKSLFDLKGADSLISAIKDIKFDFLGQKELFQDLILALKNNRGLFRVMRKRVAIDVYHHPINLNLLD